MGTFIGFAFGLLLLLGGIVLARENLKGLSGTSKSIRKDALKGLSISGVFFVGGSLLTLAMLSSLGATPEEIAAEKEAACMADPICVEARVTANRAAMAAQQEAAAAAQAQAVAKAKAEKEAAAAQAAACRLDLSCWAEQNMGMALNRCKKAIQKAALYDFEWIDGFAESKFNRILWVDEEKGVIKYMGDKLKMQNAFGAWSNMRYACDLDIANKVVLGIELEQGHL